MPFLTPTTKVNMYRNRKDKPNQTNFDEHHLEREGCNLRTASALSVYIFSTCMTLRIRADMSTFHLHTQSMIHKHTHNKQCNVFWFQLTLMICQRRPRTKCGFPSIKSPAPMLTMLQPMACAELIARSRFSVFL